MTRPIAQDEEDDQRPRSQTQSNKPRQQDRSTDLYGIARKSPDDEKGQQAWIVRLSRGGRMIQSTFSDSTYGSRAASLYVARAYRDAVLEIVPPLTRAEMRQVSRKTATSEHTSQMTGVHYVKASKGRSAAWVARIELPADSDHPTLPGTGTKRARRSITRTFSVNVMGYDAARAAAEDKRIEMLETLQDANEPALRSKAAERLHKRLRKKLEETKPD